MSPSAVGTIHTPRLVAEPLAGRHQGELSALLGDPRVGATLGGVRSADEVREILARHIAHWERHGFGLWAFRDRADGAFVGRGGLQHTMATGRDEVEVAWAVVPERWGAGLGTEIAQASLQAAFGALGLQAVVAYTMTSNTASRRVMEKAGFSYERDIAHAGLPHVVSRLRASEWAILGSNLGPCGSTQHSCGVRCDRVPLRSVRAARIEPRLSPDHVRRRAVAADLRARSGQRCPPDAAP